MAAAESSMSGPVDLVRSASHASTASNSRKSSTTRVRPSKRSSTASLARAPSPAADTKSLTSFPSLSPSPDPSPVQTRLNGWLRNALAPGDVGSKNRDIQSAASPDTVKAAPLPEAQKNGAVDKTVRKITKSTQELVGSLVSATPTRERTSLFDDTPPQMDKVPGNLHCLSEKHITELVERAGAVNLVKQLAGDLAQRDAQITALRRRAEERERILRKMLQECEVSTMDIETRLRELDVSRDQQKGGDADLLKSKKRGSEYNLPGMHPEDPIDQRLALAMEDQVSVLPDGSRINNACAQQSSSTRQDSNHSTWRNYLWNGTSRKSSRAPSLASGVGDAPSRDSSGTRQPRKPLGNDTFLPPSSTDGASGAIPTLRRLQSEDQIHSSSSSRRSSTSITSWALKMVAGNIHASRNADKGTAVRGRDRSGSNAAQRAASKDSTRTAQSVGSASNLAQRRAGRTSLGPNGTIKNITSDASKSASGVPGQPTRGLSNLGPVEMDRILPEESRPPTLVQHHNHFAASHEYLTDRFGFIYDQRRKQRQSEAAAALSKHKTSGHSESLSNGRPMLHQVGHSDDSNENAKPVPSDTGLLSNPTSRPGSRSSGEQASGPSAKTWQDYLKLATHPTELLSHTPSTAPIMETEPEPTATKVSQVTVAKRGSLPSSSVNPEPSPSRIVSGNAEFITASPSGAASPISPLSPQADPVKALLEQLTELHDSLQREKTVKWNEFLRKVRAERKREGEAVTAAEGIRHITMPEAHLADGEIIGIAGLGNKGKVGRAKWQEFRRLVLGGIPVAYRAKIWAECSGASALRIPGYYDDLVRNGVDNDNIVAQIQMDINRTLTDNIFFRKGPGVHKLNEVLLAYSRRNPEVGYCQGMNLITACLLLIMPTAEDAFWVLATMIENILPPKYYDQHLLTSRADQTVLREYVVELLPKLSAHLDLLEIELEALTFQWFLSVFTDCLSAEALFRVWDVVLCMHDGSTFLFQVALALLKLNEKALLQCDTPAGVYHYINHQMTNHAISIDSLIQASDALSKVVKRKDVEERRERAVAREQELIKQREEARKMRAKKRAEQTTGESEQQQRNDDSGERRRDGEGASLSASLDAGLSRRISPMTTPTSLNSFASEEEEAERLLRGLGDRTPMPIEEESLWRG
ncbi:TBC-domain-containing protein [Westerdykella ornata]|uniref:TBC-domain-containing protein n=1 Tax=Westerdykella ornata TaxID=318751 RepID=A0A6A6J7H1_WESOR|nr:TBC-domain-containing protein [Westerdykella ornata]KAF2272103.1 TBC-domain-containing protein [Westerdykella ornata]